MSEAAPEGTEAPAQEQPAVETPAPETPPTVEELQAKVEELTKESRKWETRSKENHQAKTELEKQRKAAMTEAERAVSEAEERGRTTAATEFGKELAQEKFDALAARRNKDFDSAPALEFVDLAKFLGEDGRPDVKAIEAAVERLVPAPTDGPPSFDGGTRTPTPPQQGMTGLIRKAAGRA